MKQMVKTPVLDGNSSCLCLTETRHRWAERAVVAERQVEALRVAIEAKDAALRAWSQALEGRRGCHDCRLRPCSEHAGDYNRVDDLSDAALSLTLVALPEDR